jgi:tape measure domain-containing protein
VSVVANVAINVDSRNAVSKLREVQAQAGATEKAFNGVAAAAGKLAVAFGALQAFKFVFAKTAELESQTRSLEVLTGSAEKAGQIIKELQQLGAVTPFTSTELIDSAKRLQAFGVETEKVVETTRRLADVSGATGAELQGLVTAYGQVQAKGRLQGEELLQFQERGVALQEELRKMYGLSGEEFQKALEKGRIGAEAVEVAVIRLTNAGGKYADGAIAQSDTLAGKWSTLTDGVETLAKTIGETLKPALKETLDFATMVVDKINQALAGPDYKKANDQLFNTRARIKELQAAIKAGEAAGIGTQAGAPVLGIDGQVMGGGQPALPGMKYELQQLQKEAQKLEQRLGSLRQQSKPAKPAAATSATPALLAEKEKPSKALNIDDLIGGNIGRRLQEQQARLSAATAKMMNTAAASENPQQAQRMVEYSSKLLNIKYQIGAIDETLTKRAEVRAEIIASEQDKVRAALAFDETTNDLKTKRLGLELEINTLLAEQTGKAQEQDRQQQKAIAEALAGLDMQMIKTAAVTEAQKQALQLLEIENTLKKAGIVLTDADRQALGLKIAEIRKLTKEQEAANAKLQMEKDLFESISSTVAGAFAGAIDAATTGTQSLGEALKGLGADLLATIGKMLMMYGIAQALGALGGGAGNPQGILSFLARGFGYRANGGPVTGGSPYVVGERGPELFVPGTGGSVVSNNDLRSAMGSAPGMGGSPVLNMSFETTSIGGVEYVSRDQLELAMAATRRQAARDGAQRGMTMTLDRLQQSPNTRRRVGF